MRTRINDFTSESPWGCMLNTTCLTVIHTYIRSATTKRSYNFRQQLNFNETFAEKHNLCGYWDRKSAIH